MGIPFRFDGRQFHFLRIAGAVTAFVTQYNHRQHRRQTKRRGYRKQAPHKTDVAFFQQIPGTDSQRNKPGLGIGFNGVELFISIPELKR